MKLIKGNSLEELKKIDEGSINCCITSPPYWGLRKYDIPDVIWDGEEGCEHEWGEEKLIKKSGGTSKSTLGEASGGHAISPEHQKLSITTSFVEGSQGQFCLHCHAWRGQLGLEPTPELYVKHLVEIFREVRRVLKKEGTLWLNLGDSYAGSGKGPEGNLNKDFEFRHLENITKPYKGNGLKPKDLVGVPWMVAFALRSDGWYLRSEIIWCLSGGARLYAKTQKEVMPATVHDLVRLDPKTVQLWNGTKWTQVLGWSQSPNPDDAIEIELRSREKIGCTPNHTWPTQRGLVEAKDLIVGDILQSCKLPDTLKPRNVINSQDVALVCGIYLAEGSKSGETLQFALHADEISMAESIREFVYRFGGSFHSHTYGKSLAVCVEGKVPMAIIDTFITGNTAKDKHLTNAAWRESDEFLRYLLDGYLLGDAHHDRPNRRWRLGFTRNYYLASDLRTLCARLGYDITLKFSSVLLGDKEYKTYRGELRMEKSDHHNNKSDTEIVAIGRSRGRSFWDIGVEDEPHLFALASGVLTHNSKPNPMPESVTDRPTKAHEQVFLLAKSQKYYFDGNAVKEPSIYPEDDRKAREIKMPDGWDTGPGAHGSFHRQGREKGQKRYPTDKIAGIREGSQVYSLRNIRTVWTIATQPYSEAHFATFPEKLVEPMIKAGCQVGGIVLDPFCGSGTVLRVAERLQRKAIGIDLGYQKLAEKRIRGNQVEMQFDDDPWR